MFQKPKILYRGALSIKSENFRVLKNKARKLKEGSLPLSVTLISMQSQEPFRFHRILLLRVIDHSQCFAFHSLSALALALNNVLLQ